MERIDQERFIEIIKKYQFLYNIDHKNYKDIHRRNEAWKEIGGLFNLSATEAKNHWTKLRNSYTNALKRRRVSNGQISRKIGKWKFEDQMSFILPYVEDRSSTNVMEDTSKNINFEDDRSVDDEIPIKDDQSEMGAPSTSTFSLDGTLNENRNELSDKENKIKKIDRNSDDMLDYLKIHTNLLGAMLTRKDDVNCAQDEDEMFYLSMGRIIKKLPKAKQSEIRMRFCSMVCQAETEFFTAASSTDRTNSSQIKINYDSQ